MRLSEKTLEINICSQLSNRYSGRLIWFGLTQKQEARAGFDTCTKIGGRLFLFQFKASCHDVRGVRRFHAPNEQMENLQKRCRSRRSVFYAFPLVGTTLELSRNSDIASQTWLLDVSDIPPLGPPLTRGGTPRKNKRHYIDVSPPTAIIRSDPMEVRIINAAEHISEIIHDTQGFNRLQYDNFNDFWSYCKLLRRTAAGLIAL